MNTKTIEKLVYPDDFFYEALRLPALKIALAKAKRLYAKIVAEAAEASNIPQEIIYSFMVIENEAINPNAGDASGKGLMQVGTSTATDCIILMNKKNQLTEKEKTLLIRGLGKARTNFLLAQKNTGKVLITENDLKNPTTNITIGAIWLNYLMQMYTEGDAIKMEKVVCTYNAGLYKKVKIENKDYYLKDLLKPADSTAVLKLANKAGGAVTTAYVKKLVGKNGMLSAVI